MQGRALDRIIPVVCVGILLGDACCDRGTVPDFDLNISD